MRYAILSIFLAWVILPAGIQTPPETNFGGPCDNKVERC